MPGQTDVTLTTPSSQNDWISAVNNIFGTISNTASSLVGTYSTFLDAKTANDLANAQANKPPQYTPTTSPGNSITALLQNKVVTTGLLVAVAAVSAFIIYKAVK